MPITDPTLLVAKCLVVFIKLSWYALRRDLVTYPLTCLLETFLRGFIGFLKAPFYAVPGGLGGIGGLVKLLVELGHLVANGWSLGLASASTASWLFRILLELIQIPIECGQLGLHCLDERCFLRVGIIFHVLRRLFCFCLDSVDLLGGGWLFVAAYGKSGGGEYGEK